MKDVVKLYNAAFDGDIDTVCKLLDKRGWFSARVNVNWTNQNGATPLYVACQNGHLEIVQRLLSEKRVIQRLDVNKAIETGATPLYIACQNGHLDVVRCLLADGRVDVNQAETGGFSPFYVACHKGHHEVVQYLLADERVDVNQANNNGATPLYIACQKGQLEVVQCLLADGRVDVNQAMTDGATPLYAACLYDHHEVVQCLMADERVTANWTNINVVIALFYAACYSGHLELMQHILGSGQVDVNCAFTSGVTPFYTACKQGQLEVVQCLLADGRVDVNQANETGATPFYIACHKGQLEVVQCLLADGRVDVNPAKRTGGYTPFWVACENNRHEVVRCLLADERVDVNQANENGTTPLYIACQKSQLEVVQCLLADGRVDVNQAVTTNGTTPLYAACCNGHHEVVQYLLADERVDINKANKNEATPLYIACGKGQLEVVQCLLLDERVDVNQADTDGWTPLYVACQEGQLEVVQCLLSDERVDVNQANKNGTTPLFIACQKAHFLIVKCLVTVPNIDFSKKCKGKTTPLMKAQADGNTEIAIFLEEAIRQQMISRAHEHRQVISAPVAAGIPIRATAIVPEPVPGTVSLPARASATPPASVEPLSGFRDGYVIDYGNVTLGERIGAGGFGEVFKGQWQFSQVAIKQLHIKHLSPSVEKDFKQEITIMAQLHHPRVVQLFGACLEPYAMVMEYMPGGSLYQRLHDATPLSWDNRYQMGTDIGAGLAYLHQLPNPIFHRDLKSPNVLIDATGRAKLTDFGLSQIKTQSSSTSTAQSAVGSLLWMAPELFKRKVTYTAKSDIYAYGIVLWELAARTLPFQDAHGNNALVIEWVKDGEREEIPAETPALFRETLERCWDQVPDHRPDAQEAHAMLSVGFQDYKASQTTAADGSGAEPEPPSVVEGHIPPVIDTSIATVSGSGYLSNAASERHPLPPSTLFADSDYVDNLNSATEPEPQHGDSGPRPS